MPILIDPPTWPAHGTVFSHLVSDTSLDELHAFARANQLSERAFDLDHYDVPAQLYDQLIQAGALALTGAELTRRLIASGLRVPLKERPSKIRRTLLQRWNSVLPQHPELGEKLLTLWEESHRKYHNSAHLLEMLTTLETLYGAEKPPRVVLLASWFHDAIYQGQPGQDEAASARLAQELLSPLSPEELAQVELNAVTELVLATASHSSTAPGSSMIEAGLSSQDSERFLDADLAILAAPKARYRRYVAGVRAEYSHLSEQDFKAGRAKVLGDFLKRKTLFISEEGQKLYEAKARKNIAQELAELTA